MAQTFPNGTVFALGTTYATAKTITAITNANPGVATSTAHGYANGDILLLTMPSRLDGKVVRVSGQTANNFNLEAVDTTSTSQYPSGFGAGTSQAVTNFVGLSQVVDVNTTGGDLNYYTWQYLEDDRQRQRPTVTNARSMQFVLDWDPSLSWHAAFLAAAVAKSVYALRATLPNGVILYYGVFVGFDGEPAMKINENVKTQISLSLASTNTRY